MKDLHKASTGQKSKAEENRFSLVNSPGSPLQNQLISANRTPSPASHLFLQFRPHASLITSFSLSFQRKWSPINENKSLLAKEKSEATEQSPHTFLISGLRLNAILCSLCDLKLNTVMYLLFNIAAYNLELQFLSLQHCNLLPLHY